MSRSRSLWCALGLVALGLVLTPITSRAEVPWGVAMRTDDEIKRFVGGLDGDVPGADAAPAVILHRGLSWDVLAGSRVLVRNTIIRVNDPASVAEIGSNFYLDARGIVGEVGVFRIRDDELTRPTAQVSPGDGRVLRARIRVDLSDLQSGDVIGASSVTRFENILYFDKVSIGARVPVAEFQLRVRCEGQHSYVIAPHNFDGLRVEEVRFDDRRPVEWLATAREVPPVPGFHGAGPYTADMPLAMIAESREFVPAIQDWANTLAWPREALFLAGWREKAVSTMVAAWELAPQVTAGATTNGEAERKIFEYVRDNLRLMAGEQYDPFGARTADEILASGMATPMEQVMMMVTLLAASGLPGEIAAVRPAAWGKLDEDLQSFVQFSDLAVRCGNDGTRYYVPYLKDAPVGTLPAAWGRSWVLVPEPGLMARVSEAAAQVMADPSVDAHRAFSEIRKRSTDEGWFVLEQVGK